MCWSVNGEVAGLFVCLYVL